MLINVLAKMPMLSYRNEQHMETYWLKMQILTIIPTV